MDDREQQMLDEAMKQTLIGQMQEVRFQFILLKHAMVNEVSRMLYKLVRLLSPLWE